MRVAYFFSESRISRNKTTSSGVGAGAAGGASFFRRFICLTIMKTEGQIAQRWSGRAYAGLEEPLRVKALRVGPVSRVVLRQVD